jgi:hypothetical protein
MPDSKVTIKIPRPLYNNLTHIVKGSGFNSVTDFIIFVLRDLISNKEKITTNTNTNANASALSPQEIEAIRSRLKSLGYF